MTDTRREAVTREHDLDCGNHSCRFARNKSGMRTNGPCTCVQNLLDTNRALADRLAQVQASYDADMQHWAQRLAVLEQQRIKYGPICLNCGKAEPCMTEEEAAQHGASIPCTFDPAPKVLFDRCKQLERQLADAQATIGRLEALCQAHDKWQLDHQMDMTVPSERIDKLVQAEQQVARLEATRCTSPWEDSPPYKGGCMYYEEKVIDGQLCYRTTPDGPWAVVEYKELIDRVVYAEKKVRQLESERESFIGSDAAMERQP